jgi:hypothetical protein
LQGALFSQKTTNTKIASLQNTQLAEAIKLHQHQGAKILYLTEHRSEIMFWQNSIAANKLPIEKSFNLSNETFHGFENSMPSCRSGVVLCQGQPLGEILGLVINQLSVCTQFSPKKIVFYTADKQRGEIVSVIGSRIGALVEINLVEKAITLPTTPDKITPQKLVKVALPKKKTEATPIKHKVKVKIISPPEKIPQKTENPERILAPIKIDESKLEAV